MLRAVEAKRRRLRELQVQEARYGNDTPAHITIDHHGKLIEDAGWFWDHAEQRHLGGGADP